MFYVGVSGLHLYFMAHKRLFSVPMRHSDNSILQYNVAQWQFCFKEIAIKNAFWIAPNTEEYIFWGKFRLGWYVENCPGMNNKSPLFIDCD